MPTDTVTRLNTYLRQCAPHVREREAAQLIAEAAAELEAALDWKEAVIDALIVSFAYQTEHENDPRKALSDLLAWEMSIALDPRVSKEAQNLIDRGARAAMAAQCPVRLAEFAATAKQLKTRAEIRRAIPRSEPDRISDACEAGAAAIEALLAEVGRLRDRDTVARHARAWRAWYEDEGGVAYFPEDSLS